jgi:predicted transcriptional regulator
MKAKTSITLSEDLIQAIDQLADGMPRSAFIERVLRAFVRRQERARADARDLMLLNRHAEQLNAEAADVLEYQSPWSEE